MDHDIHSVVYCTMPVCVGTAQAFTYYTTARSQQPREIERGCLCYEDADQDDKTHCVCLSARARARVCLCECVCVSVCVCVSHRR